MPEEIRRWNWGAFSFTWIWGLANHTYIALLGLIPGVGVVMRFVLGVKGNDWAWRNKWWDSVDHFKRTQRKWAWAALFVFVPICLIGILAIVAEVAGTSSGETTGRTRGAEDPRGFVLERAENGRFAIALPPGWQTAPPEEDFEFTAVDATAAEDATVVPGVAVASEDAAPLESLDEYLERSLRSLPEGTELLEQRRVEVPAGPAYRLEVSLTDENGKVGEIIYLLLHDDRGYVVFFVADPGQLQAKEKAFGQMMSSFRFLR